MRLSHAADLVRGRPPGSWADARGRVEGPVWPELVARKRLVEGKHVKVSGQVESDIARRVKAGKRVELAAGTVELKESGAGSRESAAGRQESGVRSQKSANASRGRTPKPAKKAQKHSTPEESVPGIAIVYSDDSIVVANKPAGLTTMRHREEADEFGQRGKKFLPKTLADLLPAMLGAPGRPVIAVHRIDRDTSGLVVFALTRLAAKKLTKQFREHSAERRYLAMTRGVPKVQRIESIFVRDRGDARRGSSPQNNSPDGKRAITHVSVLEDMGNFALVECRLETGRTHQVRIHLGEAGTPLCGETVYDRPVNGKPAPDESGAKRPMLHAARLGFKHPESGESMSWEAVPPEDFAVLLKRLRK